MTGATSTRAEKRAHQTAISRSTPLGPCVPFRLRSGQVICENSHHLHRERAPRAVELDAAACHRLLAWIVGPDQGHPTVRAPRLRPEEALVLAVEAGQVCPRRALALAK